MNMDYTITRDGDDVTVSVSYTHSAAGIDFAVSDGIELTQAETDNLYAAICEFEGEE